MNKLVPELPNWKFDVEEVSAGVYKVIATSDRGHRVSKTGFEPDELIEDCKNDALDIEKTSRC